MLCSVARVDLHQGGQGGDTKVLPVVVGGRHEANDGLGGFLNQRSVGIDGGDGADHFVGNGWGGGGGGGGGK